MTCSYFCVFCVYWVIINLCLGFFSVRKLCCDKCSAHFRVLLCITMTASISVKIWWKVKSINQSINNYGYARFKLVCDKISSINWQILCTGCCCWHREDSFLWRVDEFKIWISLWGDINESAYIRKLHEMSNLSYTSCRLTIIGSVQGYAAFAEHENWIDKA
jgi:hypothetical protein